MTASVLIFRKPVASAAGINPRFLAVRHSGPLKFEWLRPTGEQAPDGCRRTGPRLRPVRISGPTALSTCPSGRIKPEQSPIAEGLALRHKVSLVITVLISWATTPCVRDADLLPALETLAVSSASSSRKAGRPKSPKRVSATCLPALNGRSCTPMAPICPRLLSRVGLAL